MMRLLHGLIQKSKLDAEALPFRYRKHGPGYAVTLGAGSKESIHQLCLDQEAAETWLVDRLTTEE